jgi:hypothetical protein
MQIITVDDWRTYIGAKRPEIEIGIDMQIKAANALITSALGISSDTTGEDLLDVRPARTKYFLSSPTISTITDIERISGPGGLPAYRLFKGGILMFSSPPDAGTINVSYDDAGIGEIGPDLKLAGCMLVEHWNKREYRESKTFGGETMQFNSTKSGIPEHIRTIIELYRRL